jgi:hypothetical protein
MTAEWLAAMTDIDFGTLMSGLTEPRGPQALYQDHLNTSRTRETRREGERAALGQEGPQELREWALASAAQDLLHTAMAGGATSVNDMAVELASRLDIVMEDGTVTGAAMREGIETVIREAMRNETPRGGEQAVWRKRKRGESWHQELEGGCGHPSWITWQDPHGYWRRIPWAAAHLAHLRFMADYRQHQAQAMQAAADELSALTGELEKTAGDDPGLTRLADLWMKRAS